MPGWSVIPIVHEPRWFVESVHYNTSPGHGSGGNWREENGLPGGGPSALVTSKATFGFDTDGELYLRTVHPGVVIEEIKNDLEWALQTAADVGKGTVAETAEPSVGELDLIRVFDPDGFWTH